MNTHRLFTALGFFGFLFFSLTATAQTPGFSANNTAGCAPLSVVFTASLPPNVANYSWNFGNGQTSLNTNNVPVTYATAGTFTVTLVINYTGGTQDVITQNNYITVYTPPVANFTANPTQVCVGQSVQFTNTTAQGSGTINSWQWDFGDGSPLSTTQNPSHVYTLPGNYPITLIATDVNGCQDVEAKPAFITVIPPPVASFTINPTLSCAVPTNIATAWTGSAAFTHSWNAGGGTPATSTATTPTFTYNTNGTYTITHIVTGAQGCSTTATQTVQVGQAAPTISVATGSQTCTNTPITFNWSQVALNNISWNSGGGIPATSTSPSPSFSYANPGTYTVTATMTDQQTGCASNATISITIQPSPTGSFTASDTVACQTPLAVSFTSVAGAGNAYSWNFGDGTTSTAANPSHTYNTFGNFTVSLTLTSSGGCKTTITKPNYIKIQQPVAAFTVNPSSQGCVPFAVSFLDQSTSLFPITNWQWDLGGGVTSTIQNPTNTYTNVGQYTVSLIITNSLGCKDTLVKSNHIKAGTEPTVNFTASPLVTCASDPVAFTNLSTPPPGAGITYSWNFGDNGTSTATNPNYTYQDTGYMDVALVVNNQGCRDTLIMSNYVYVIGPVAKFTNAPNQSCVLPATLTLTNQSIQATTYFWDFGDGTTDTSPNPPPHIYNNPGSYTISLTVSNPTTNCSDVFTKTFNVNPAVANFVANTTQACAPDSIYFFNISAASTSCKWDFGDGTTSTQCNPVHFYDLPGVYTVSLIITNAIGCKDTLVQQSYINMNGLPVGFLADTTLACAPASIQFTDNTIQTSPILQWSWSFGDGTTSTLPNPSHQYATGDTFTVSLTVLDANGCNSTLTIPNFVQVNQPVAAFNTPFPINCTGNIVPFYSSSTGSGLYYSWAFGDGSGFPISSPTPTHIYNANGNYSVSLTITDIIGCKDTLVLPNYVTIATLNADFTASGVSATCPPLLTTLSPLPSAPFNITAWNWAFGDGGVSAFQNPQHIYALPGTYSITYIATSNAGCKDTIVKANLVNIAGPIAPYTITPTSTCPNIDITFNSTGTNVAQYLWNFGDGNTSTLADPLHHYAMPGNYIPTLTVTDAGGCSVLMPVVDTVKIFVPPIANFGVDSTLSCLPSLVTFTDSTIAGNSPLTAWDWNYGDNTTGTGSTSGHTYTTAGYMDVTLTVTDANGCKDTLTKDNITYVLPNNSPNPKQIVSVSVVNDTLVKVVFNKYIDAIGDFGQYRLYRASGGNPPVLIKYITQISDTSHVDTVAAANLESYCYTLETVNHCGTSSVSSNPHCTINVVATPLIDQIQIDWNAYTAWNVQKYRIYRVNNYNINNITLMDSVAGNVLTWTDKKVECWVPYNYRIEAVKAASNLRVWSDTAQMVSLHFTALNGVNVNYATVIDNRRIAVKWTIPTTITRLQLIKIDRMVDSAQTYSQLGLFYQPNLPSQFVDNTVNVYRKYDYRIYAVDSCGDITALGRSGGNIRLSAYRNGGEIKLVWNAYREWVDGVDHYIVELQNKFNGVYDVIGTVSGEDTTFFDTKSRYPQDMNCYRVRAIEKNNPTVASLSNEACAPINALVHVPNAFSPNGDTHNDFFYVVGSFVMDYEIEIVDRWGVSVFQSRNIDLKWDGKFKGKDVPEGVYMYRMKVVGLSGQVDKMDGTITIFR